MSRCLERIITTATVAVAMATVTANPGCGDPGTPGHAEPVALDVSPASRIHTLLEAYREAGQFNGVALVAEGDDIVLERGYGLADLTWEVPATPDTRFRIASISKAITATLVMLLVEDGLLELDRPFGDYLTGFERDHADVVTIRQLLSHTSGLDWRSPVEATDTPIDPEYPSMRQLVRWIEERVDLVAEPGARSTYSNAGYVLLAAICEHVTGERFADLLADRILDPLDMHDTELESLLSVHPRLARGYRVRSGEWFEGGPVDMRLARGNGGLIATAGDLFRFSRAFFAGNLVEPETRATMLTPVQGRWGFAWSTDTDLEDFPDDTGRLVWHRGSNGYGFKSQLLVDVDRDRTVILLTNLDRSPRWEITRQILHLLDGGEAGLPHDDGLVALRRSIDSRPVGEATERLRERMNATPDHAAADLDALVDLGLARLRAGDLREAHHLLQVVASAAPASDRALVSLAFADATMGRDDDARARCLTILARTPYHEDVHDVAALLEVDLVHPPLDDPVHRALVEGSVDEALDLDVRSGEEELLPLGYRLVAWDELAAAERVFRYWVAIDPDDWNAHDSLGEVLLARGGLDGAAAEYERSLVLNPDNDHGRTMLRRIEARRASSDPGR